MDVDSFVKGVAVGAVVTGLATLLFKDEDNEKLRCELPRIANQITKYFSDNKGDSESAEFINRKALS